MNDVIVKMLARYDVSRLENLLHALREILQEIALLGLWRSKFFNKAAFYGGTALRILHGLDRFSEELDFSLLAPDTAFDLAPHLDAVEKELAAFGFNMQLKQVKKTEGNPIRSAFLKAGTRRILLVIEAEADLVASVHSNQVLKIKLEVDTDPPPGFGTRTRYLLQPIPFMVRAYVLPDLFAGKMHALLYRRWRHRVKGRDWYDLVWYAANHPGLHLAHLEQRMRQSGDWQHNDRLTEEAFRKLMAEAIETLDVRQAKSEAESFIRSPDAIAVWSKGFFRDVAGRIQCIE
ncbi:MAG: nucleotidyl transferase AbiEii/AbiGii toxin family protein [Desulfobacterales bacterium]|nr:nucleotidyl transferase AbiEii/AbiGii toxin family protein [Desulfobacterales bacterium]